MSRTVPFYRHQLGKREVDALAAVLEGVFLTTGPRTKDFEEKLAAMLGVEHTLAISSATTALFLALKGLGIGPGDEVITTPMTFIASSNVVLHCGAKPVFVDVEADTGNIDVTKIAAAITPRTKAIMPVHLYGLMADMKAIAQLAADKKLHVVEDCAHAFESERDGVKPGQLSDAAAFSFYATKNITSGEGGALAMKSTALFDKVKLLRLHGMSASAHDRYTGTYRHWDMTELGYKANLGDLQSALLLTQLPDVMAKNELRIAIAKKYDERLANVPGLAHPASRPNARHAHHLYTVWVPPDRRDEILNRLQQAGIGVAVNFRAVHLLTYYKVELGFTRGMFPNAERIGDSTISLPMYPTLADDDIDYVAETLKQILATPA